MMERGDQVLVTQGTYRECTGQVVFLDHVDSLATIALDQHSMLLKISIASLELVTCKSRAGKV